MRRHFRVGLAGALVACAFTAAFVGAPRQRPAAAAGRTMALGVDALPSSGQSQEQALAAVESQLGRKLAFTRDFKLWDSYFPSTYEQWLGARGTIPMISVKPVHANGTRVTWGAIAAAQPGSAIWTTLQTWAQRIRNFRHPVYFTLSHEPETSTNMAYGTAAQFVAAWRVVHHIFGINGATNAKFVWIMTSWAFEVPSSDRRAAWRWYPGDGYLSQMAADAYNWWTCNPSDDWTSLSTVMSGFIAFGKQHPAERLWLAEFASNEDSHSPGRKAAWINDTRTLLKSSMYSQVAGISYYDAPDSQGRPCAWPYTSSTSAKSAMVSLARDSFYGGSAW